MPERSTITWRRFIHAGSSAALGVLAAGGSAAAARDVPNVLLVIVDTLRADHVGAYGGRARTPNIDALAREGIRFTRTSTCTATATTGGPSPAPPATGG